MKYLKKFKKINEILSNNEKLDFDLFKDIMTYITDDYSDVDFSDYNNDGYECVIKHNSDEYKDLYTMLEYLAHESEYLLPYEDDPQPFNDYILNKCISSIDEKIKKIKSTNLNIIIEQDEKIKNTLLKIKEEIIPRMSQYENYIGCNIGFGNNNLYISVELES